MEPTAVLAREEYVEQAYFFRALRERLADGQSAQDTLLHLKDELLSITRLPLAVDFLLGELRHTGLLGAALAKLPHYFTSFQAFVVERAEEPESRFPFDQALVILEKLAEYRAGAPSPAGQFVFQLEVLARNRLGYAAGLKACEQDAFYSESWREYLRLVRGQLGARDVAELIFARSEHYRMLRRRSEPDYEPPFAILFGEKEGKIAAANQGKDPMFLFATLQRQLGYPEVPRPPRRETRETAFDELKRKVTVLETKLTLLEGEVTGNVDLTKFYMKKEGEQKPPTRE